MANLNIVRLLYLLNDSVRSSLMSSVMALEVGPFSPVRQICATNELRKAFLIFHVIEV